MAIMEILNEDCLLHVFRFLEPNDWVSMSEVCMIWESLVLPFWPRVNTFAINKSTIPKIIENVPIFTVKRMIEAAGQHISNVSFDMNVWNETSQTHRIQFGKYLAMLDEEMRATDVIKLLAQVSGNILEIELRNMKLNKEDFTVLKTLVEANSGIKKLKLIDSFMDTIIDGDLIMRSLEELNIYLYLHIEFHNLTFKNFQGRFPNLRKLNIFLDLNASIIGRIKFSHVNVFFYDIIPHAKELKSLNVKINFRRSCDLYDPKLLLSFGDATEIEDLRIMLSVGKINANLEDSVLEKIISKSANLRNVTLSRFRISRASIERLMALPKLEKLSLKGTILLTENMQIPILVHLKKFGLNSGKGTLKYESLCKVIDRMPALSELSLYGLLHEDELIFACRLIITQIEANKQVLVNNAKCSKYLFKKLVRSIDMNGSKASMFNFNIATENIRDFIQNVYGVVYKSVPDCILSEIES